MTGTWPCAKFFAGGTFASLAAVGHQEPMGRDAQRGVTVKPAPAPVLIVAQPKVRLQVLVVALTAPAHLCEEHHFLPRGRPANPLPRTRLALS